MKHNIVFDLILIFGATMVFLYLGLGMLSEADDKQPIINETPELAESYNETHMFDEQIITSWRYIALAAIILGIFIAIGIMMSKLSWR